MRAAALPALFLALGACTPKAPLPTPVVQLDCRLGFDALKAKVLAQPGLDAKPKEPTDNFRAYSVDEGRASNIVTDETAPAHPAILMQQVTGQGGMKDSGCAFGDAKAYAALRDYLISLRDEIKQFELTH